MNLLSDDSLEQSAIVANCQMNRERNLRGSNGYDHDLRMDPLDHLKGILDRSEQESVVWLDLCCGTGRALIQAADIAGQHNLPIQIVGIDLVDYFDDFESHRLQLHATSIRQWDPTVRFDLITCVHGLHYVGDKLDAIKKCIDWLTPDGTFVAHLDLENIKLSDGTFDKRTVVKILRNAGLEYSFRDHLLSCDRPAKTAFPLRYLGADDTAGPNFTGQSAVNSWYEWNETKQN